MPVYKYHCDNCGVEFEKQQSFRDEPLVRCKECGKKTLRKVYQPVGIVFKGSGFYATDHHSPSGQSSKKEEKDEKEEKKDSAESKASEKQVDKSSENKGNNGSTETTKTDKDSKQKE